MRSDSTISRPILLLLGTLLLIPACQRQQTVQPPVRSPIVVEKHATTAAIDTYETQLAGPLDVEEIPVLFAKRWLAVQNAVAYHGTTHRDAFYGSRAYWHTGSTRGIGWALDQQGDLDEAFYIATKGNVRVAGDVNQDIEIAGNAIVHILGDLNATLDLQGVCEVIIGGDLSDQATIICDGQLELFVGGDSTGILGSTASSTVVIDGNAGGTIQASAPATVLTITGDLLGEVLPPKNKEALLTLRVDGYVPTAKMLDFASAGFTRVNATIGLSDSPPGLYPQDPNAPRPKARWVVLEQNTTESSPPE
ncbi:MAG: hypothetical protein AAGI37_15620 [Planctomycetota bacterium]